MEKITLYLSLIGICMKEMFELKIKELYNMLRQTTKFLYIFLYIFCVSQNG